MYGAILGDIIGSPYEFDAGEKTKDFPLFSERSQFTDDSVLTVAVGDACMEIDRGMSDDEIKKIFRDKILLWGNRYPGAGYGARFLGWLSSESPEPYGSFGNGSAMRVSPVGFYFEGLDTVRRIAGLSAAVSHNHPEGIKGARSVACAIRLALDGCDKEGIKDYVVKEFGYDLSSSCDRIRPSFRHDETCQVTVPRAFAAFFDGRDFEDVIRNAVSLGGDADTVAAVAGGLAEAFYGVPERLKKECVSRLDAPLARALGRFYGRAL